MATNLASTSASCPFCKGAVSQDTLRFGGNCTHCMLEIPGEEAPTDPGAQARARAEQEARVVAKRASRRRTVLLVVALLCLIGLSAGGVAFYQAQQTALTFEMDDYYQVDLSQIEGAPEVVASAEPAVTHADPAVPAAPVAVRRVEDRTPVVTPNAQPTGAVAARGISTTVTAEAATLTSEGGVKLGDVKIGVSRLGESNVVLDDDEAIRDMTRRYITSYSPQLQNCYNQRLKQVEGLQGAWKVSFEIGRDGTTDEVDVIGVNAKDGELEACMVRNVKGWRFQRIARVLPVTKTYRFGAAAW